MLEAVIERVFISKQDMKNSRNLLYTVAPWLSVKFLRSRAYIYGFVIFGWFRFLSVKSQTKLQSIK
jgi:hypothetical protein